MLLSLPHLPSVDIWRLRTDHHRPIHQHLQDVVYVALLLLSIWPGYFRSVLKMWDVLFRREKKKSTSNYKYDDTVVVGHCIFCSTKCWSAAKYRGSSSVAGKKEAGHLVGDKMCEQDILRGNYREMPINSVFRLSIKSVVVEFKRPHTHEKETFFHPPIHSKGETIKQSQFTVNWHRSVFQHCSPPYQCHPLALIGQSNI